MRRALGHLAYLVCGVIVISALAEAATAVLQWRVIDAVLSLAGAAMIMWIGAGVAIRLGVPLPPSVERLPLFRH